MKPAAALLFGASALLLGGAAPARAGYSDLSREWDSYEPPALARPRPAAPPEQAPVGSPEGDFERQVAQLRQAAARWEEALRTPPTEESFLAPDPALVTALAPQVADPAAAHELLSRGFSLETLEVLALLRSPAVKAKEREVRAAVEGYSQVENLDTLLRRYATFNASLMVGVGTAENPDSPALKFPFPGVLALKGEAVGQAVRAAREELEAARRDAVTRARKTYWELLYLQRAEAVTAEMLELLGTLRASASARYESGQASFQDVVRMGVEQEKTREELTSLRNERHHMQADLEELLDLPPGGHWGAPEPREPGRDLPDRDALYARAAERNQEVRGARAMVGRMERMLEMSESMVYPGFSLGLSLREKDEITRVGAAGMEGGGSSFPTVTTAGMGEGLPKSPGYGRDEAYLRETRQRIAGLKAELAMREAAARFQVHGAWTRLERAEREEALYADRLVTLSRAALDAAAQGYAAGKVAFSDLIEAANGWLAARLGLERAKGDLGAARADLEAAVGTTALP